MKIWLIYNAERYARNEPYAKLYLTYFAKKNVDCELIFIEKLSISGGGWHYDKARTDLPDCAIMRTLNPNLSRMLERFGVRVFNDSTVAEICNDKYKTHLFAVDNGIPVMDTKLITPGGDDRAFGFPYVMKSLDGHGGKEVYLVENGNERAEVESCFAGKPYIVQKAASALGKDLRVYVMGGEILAGMMRTSTKSFKSNFTLGGNAERVEISSDVKKIAEKIIRLLPSDYIGVDFVFDDGEPRLNEIEDIVGSRMLYAEGIDAVSLYVDYILSVMSAR